MKINPAVVVALKKALPSKTITMDVTSTAIQINTSKITAANPNPVINDRWGHEELEEFHLLTPALQATIISDLAGTATNF